MPQQNWDGELAHAASRGDAEAGGSRGSSSQTSCAPMSWECHGAFSQDSAAVGEPRLSGRCGYV